MSCLLYPRAAFSLCVLLLQACKSAACASLVYSLYPGRSGALSGFHDHGHPKDLLCVLRTFLVQYLYISETLLVYLLQKPCTPHIQRSCVPCTSLCSSHAHLLYCTYMLCASLGHLLYNFCTSLSHFFPHTMHTRCSVYTCSAQPSDMPCTNLVYPLYTPPPFPLLHLLVAGLRLKRVSSISSIGKHMSSITSCGSSHLQRRRPRPSPFPTEILCHSHARNAYLMEFHLDSCSSSLWNLFSSTRKSSEVSFSSQTLDAVIYRILLCSRLMKARWPHSWSDPSFGHVRRLQ